MGLDIQCIHVSSLVQNLGKDVPVQDRGESIYTK